MVLWRFWLKSHCLVGTKELLLGPTKLISSPSSTNTPSPSTLVSLHWTCFNLSTSSFIGGPKVNVIFETWSTECKVRGIIPPSSTCCNLVQLGVSLSFPVWTCPPGLAAPLQQHHCSSVQPKCRALHSCWISWGSCQPISLARRNSLYGRKLIHEYFFTDCVLENAISDRVCYSPSLSVHLSLPTRFKSLNLIFLSCRFSHQAFLMPFRHSAHKMNNSYSLYYSGPWHWYIGNTIFLLFTSFSALISFVLDM